MIPSESPLEIAAQIDALTASIEGLQEESELVGIEAELLAGYLHRKGAKEEKTGGVDSDSSVQGKRLIGRGRGGASNASRKILSLQEKYDIAQEEMRVIQGEVAQANKRSDHNMDILKALMEETDISAAEVKRDAFEFRRDIVVGAENPRTGKTIAERVLRYFEDKLTQKDMLLSKLLMKNKAMRTSIRRTEAQLRDKEQAGDGLQYIDFHQLQIENQEFVRKIDEANKELISLKKNYTKVTNQVNLTKKRIGDLLSEETLLKQEIDGRKRLLSKAEQDILKVVSEREKARKENSKLRVQSRNSNSAGSGTGSDGPRFMECLTLKVGGTEP
ncbi:hypothetical protein FOZ60_010342 [Perkinsus olseni]|uniref:Cilia- and flagella-associated protein 263 n=1 Tax=Perkinsus olseni TaxID=32597 RepID=A0A7J6PBY8_PEROL|nr:hypothetical protein FOZ60_010342 [Perkinsus olseni]